MTVQCFLCPKHCVIRSGQSGECRIRVNIGNRLVAVTYGYPCSVHIDPIEKKPLYHFKPGTGIFSIATVGCNLHCINCQNWEISQQNPEDVQAYSISVPEVINLAKQYKCDSVAYTYTDPVVFYEYTLDCSLKAKEAGLSNVLVTAGYLNKEPLKKLFECVHAANIDLKSLSDSFYRHICQATLKPVLDSLTLAKSMGVWLEVTNLVIPTLNDSEREIKALARWMKRNLGPETPLHFSRFSPRYKLRNLPPTPIKTLEMAYNTAKSEGLYYVYVGNLLNENWQTTWCYNCGKAQIRRQGYRILENSLEQVRRPAPVGKRLCPYCGSEVFGRGL